MEGENKNMKMKKLTALALAGALCLGMSTVALAAPSVGPKDAITATTENGESVTLVKDDISIGIGTPYDGWDSTNPDKASDAIKDTLATGAIKIEQEINRIKQENDPKDAGEIAELERQKAAVEELANSDVLLEVATLVDLKVPEGQVVDPRHPLTVKFVLNKRLENLKEGQQIRIMHEVQGLWQIYEGEVKWDAATSEFYVEHDFTSLSPVAILRINSDGSTQVTPPAEQPGDTNQPSVTPTPDENGNITADQLADLIVRRLQANGVRFERTAATGRSPKTGE